MARVSSCTNNDNELIITRGLEHGARILKRVAHCGADLVVGDRHDIVYQRVADPEHLP